MPKDKQTKKIPLQFDNAKEAQELVERLIPKYHPHLADAKIKCLFRNQVVKRAGGKIIIATAEKCTAKFKFLTKLDFIISICYLTWRDLSDKQRMAIMDHELCHCIADEDEETGEILYKVIPHDFEDFLSVVEKYGAYLPSLENLKNIKD
jgi:hypothetical protein